MPLLASTSTSPSDSARSVSTAVVGVVREQGHEWPIVRRSWRGPDIGIAPLRLGLFGVVHGDEPAGAEALQRLLARLDAQPELGRGLELHCYPVCNPAGLAAGTRGNGRGIDLNREFWRGSEQPEVIALERELRRHAFDGIVALHADCDSSGLYAFARGAVIVHELVEPALRAAEGVCPRNTDVTIDGFHARNGVIREWYPGVLGAPPEQSPVPFEIVLETPGRLSVDAQADAGVRALLGLMGALPRLVSIAANI